jgi:hypothetical protein
MRVPICFLCNKYLVRIGNAYEGGYVEFAEYVKPEEHEPEEEAMIGDPDGFEWFCNEHLSAAQALSHLTSKEALVQLEQQFGKFEELEPEPDPPPTTRWQRFYCWFWKHFI